jgi:hypothetical protein
MNDTFLCLICPVYAKSPSTSYIFLESERTLILHLYPMTWCLGGHPKTLEHVCLLSYEGTIAKYTSISREGPRDTPLLLVRVCIGWPSISDPQKARVHSAGRDFRGQLRLRMWFHFHPNRSLPCQLREKVSPTLF